MAVKVKVRLQLGPEGPQNPLPSCPSPSGLGMRSQSQKAERLHREGKESLETALGAHLQRCSPWTPLCPPRGRARGPRATSPIQPRARSHSHLPQLRPCQPRSGHKQSQDVLVRPWWHPLCPTSTSTVLPPPPCPGRAPTRHK